MAKKTIIVQGNPITLLPRQNEEEYISLTDIMKNFDNEFAIYSWLRNKNTVEFLGVWEQLHNENFKGNEFVRFKNEAGSNNFNLTPKKWIEETDGIGLVIKAGKYGGGTFAHRDIAINFCYWLSPTFQLYLIKEFQRLKVIEAEQKKESLDWNIKRTLAKVNYSIHTDAVKNYLMPTKIQDTKFESVYYATEADVLNLSLFGYTAKEWHDSNPQAKGNLRDNATTEQLLVLANLENLNAEFIKMGFSKQQRLTKLNDIAIYQMRLLVNKTNLGFLKSGEDKTQLLLDNNE
jgi:KilA-N domain